MRRSLISSNSKLLMSWYKFSTIVGTRIPRKIPSFSNSSLRTAALSPRKILPRFFLRERAAAHRLSKQKSKLWMTCQLLVIHFVLLKLDSIPSMQAKRPWDTCRNCVRTRELTTHTSILLTPKHVLPSLVKNKLCNGGRNGNCPNNFDLPCCFVIG